MRRLFLLMLMFAANTALVAAGSPQLLVAIRTGDPSQVQKLLAGGADVNTADGDGGPQRFVLSRVSFGAGEFLLQPRQRGIVLPRI